MDSRNYVANTFDATITVIDGDTFGVENVYTVGGSPSEIAVSLDGALLYVTNDDQSFVSVIDSADGTVVDTIEVGNPWAMAISADGTRLYVTSVGFSSSSSLSVIDTSTNLVLNTVPVAAEPYGVAVSADGTVAYVTSAATKTMQVVYLGVLNRAPVSSAAPTVGSPGDYGIVTGDLNMVDPEGDTLIYTVTAQPAYGTVTVNPNTGVYSYAPSLAARIAAVQSTAIETDTFTVGVSDGVNVATPVTVDGVLVAELEPNAPAAVISIPSSNPNGTSAPSGMTFSPDGTRAYITDLNSDQLTIIDTATGAVIGTVTIAPGALDVAASPDGTRVYTANYNAGTVSIIDTTNGAVNTITVGDFPSGVVFSSDGEHAYVTNQTGNRVTIIEVASDTIVGTIPVGGRPIGVAVNADETRLYTANNQTGTVSVVDLTNNSVLATIPVGGQPISVVLNTSGSLAYVSNFAAGKVSVIDTGSNTVLTDIAITGPTEIAIHDDRLYVIGVNTNTLTVIDTTTNGVIDTFPVGPGPTQVEISPNGHYVYVTNANGASTSVIYLNRAPVASAAPTVGSPGDYGIVTGDLNMVDPEGDTLIYTVTAQPAYGTVTVNPNTGVYSYAPSLAARIAAVQSTAIETDTFTVGVSDGVNVATPVTVDGVLVAELEPNAPAAVISIPSSNPNGTSAPSGMTFSPDGTRAYITDLNSDQLTIIDTATGAVIGTVTIAPGALDVAASPDGTRVYTANYNAGTVSIIDTTNGAVNTITVGDFPSGVVFSSDGEHAYVTNQTGNRVTIIEVASDTIVGTIPVGGRPIGVAVNADETRLYTANNQTGTVSVVDLTNNSVIATIPVGGQPISVVLNTSGSLAYVSNFAAGKVSVIDTGSNTVLTDIAITGPTEIAIHDNRLYVIGVNTNTLTVIDTTTNGVVDTFPVGPGPTQVEISPNGHYVYVTNATAPQHQ